MFIKSNSTNQINNSFSDRNNIEFGVPQGSLLEPLSFIIDVIDLFYELEDYNVANYADDKTPYSCAADIRSVALELKASASKLFRWFKNN